MIGTKNPAVTGLRKDSSNRNYSRHQGYQQPREKLLPLLNRVKQKSCDSWYASCPTKAHKHGDRSRGLAIRELPDGTLLMHCPAGCDNRDILSSIGLSLRDLFPPAAPQVRAERKAKRKQQINRDALEYEVLLCEIFLSDLVKGRKITADDVKRNRLAMARVLKGGAHG